MLTFLPTRSRRDSSAPPAPLLDGFESTASESQRRRRPILAAIPGLEQASEETEERDVPTESLLTVEADSWSEPVEPVPHVSGLESPRVSLSGTHPSLSP